jgi:hypothetical protein
MTKGIAFSVATLAVFLAITQGCSKLPQPPTIQADTSEDGDAVWADLHFYNHGPLNSNKEQTFSVKLSTLEEVHDYKRYVGELGLRINEAKAKMSHE